MSKLKKGTIEAKGLTIQIYTEDFKNDYISLTDIARYKSEEPFIVINNWLRGKDNIQFLGLWESIHNPDFKPVEFDRFRKEAGSNAFTLSPQKWIEKTNAIGIVSKSGRYGGTFAHSDIAMEFASWISPEFKLYIIQDYKRLKSDENSKLSLGWNLNREISKINYKIHTDAIKEYLVKDLTNEQLSYKYASEADMLNVALFNKRAKQWRNSHSCRRVLHQHKRPGSCCRQGKGAAACNGESLCSPDAWFLSGSGREKPAVRHCCQFRCERSPACVSGDHRKGAEGVSGIRIAGDAGSGFQLRKRN